MPVLLLFGGRDSHTPTDLAMKKWEQGLREAGNAKFQIKLFSDASHAIRVGEHHGPANDVTDFAPGYFETMGTWLREISAMLSKE